MAARTKPLVARPPCRLLPLPRPAIPVHPNPRQHSESSHPPGSRQRRLFFDSRRCGEFPCNYSRRQPPPHPVQPSKPCRLRFSQLFRRTAGPAAARGPPLCVASRDPTLFHSPPVCRASSEVRCLFPRRLEPRRSLPMLPSPRHAAAPCVRGSRWPWPGVANARQGLAPPGPVWLSGPYRLANSPGPNLAHVALPIAQLPAGPRVSGPMEVHFPCK
ncbi:hypothetical protein PR202_ga17117 [Eleusine coracana subsp. coracana]|uniref:Uncharacterized protein n=1 Tax=Eleusine coracana subsp. coracana TaxID=191504 RepID=A0AAV5CPE9_ELECO|nr:hypothetical protein PR202_ga17117 [Eleusine coracana subsp. coracana]